MACLSTVVQKRKHATDPMYYVPKTVASGCALGEVIVGPHSANSMSFKDATRLWLEGLPPKKGEGFRGYFVEYFTSNAPRNRAC